VSKQRSLQPRTEERRYRCETCDVYGLGTECWYCGSEQLEWSQEPVMEHLPVFPRPNPRWLESPPVSP
jgi:hypothetical protein